MVRRIPVMFVALLALINLAPAAHAAVTLLDKDDWKVTMGGFIEMDTINDSVRSFTEVVGNNPVDRPGTFSGDNGRTQFSIRNTRLDFGVEAPVTDGWKTRGYMEFDLLGTDLSPTTTAPTNSEAGFFNNPTFRVRHAFLNAEKDGWTLMAGQYWALFGWQPYYFIPSVQVAPIPSMLYSRTAQARAMKSMDLAEAQSLQIALGVMRPPQRDAEYPGIEAGARYIMSSRSAGFTGGATGAMKAQPMSIGVSGAFRELEYPNSLTDSTAGKTDHPGSALAIDALIPILASSDGKDVSNTLMLGGEFSAGTGYGDEFNGWSGNTPSAYSSTFNLDSGMAGINSGSLELIDLRTWDAYLQYHLPAQMRTALAVGGSQLFSDNVTDVTASAGKVAYNRTQSAFINLMHDFTDQIRVGAEYAFIRTTYADSVAASDNRYQISFWYIF